jgi:nucleoside 2-deoxyribosyltransferase
MGKLYIGSSLYNAEEVRKARDKFIAAGHSITYDWTTHGKVTTKEELQKYGEEELNGVAQCDVFFMMQPSRYGTHIEFGIALGLGKPIVMIVDHDSETKTFYMLKNVHRFDDFESAFDFTLEYLKAK